MARGGVIIITESHVDATTAAADELDTKCKLKVKAMIWLYRATCTSKYRVRLHNEYRIKYTLILLQFIVKSKCIKSVGTHAWHCWSIGKAVDKLTSLSDSNLTELSPETEKSLPKNP